MPHAVDTRGFEACAHLCHECQDKCLRTLVHCLDRGGPNAARPHSTLLMDCIAICGLAHGFLHRQSPHHAHACRACAEICSACADGCERIANGDSPLRTC